MAGLQAISSTPRRPRRATRRTPSSYGGGQASGQNEGAKKNSSARPAPQARRWHAPDPGADAPDPKRAVGLQPVREPGRQVKDAASADRCGLPVEPELAVALEHVEDLLAGGVGGDVPGPAGLDRQLAAPL